VVTATPLTSRGGSGYRFSHKAALAHRRAGVPECWVSGDVSIAIRRRGESVSVVTCAR